jgi:hypothetical protein
MGVVRMKVGNLVTCPFECNPLPIVWYPPWDHSMGGHMKLRWIHTRQLKNWSDQLGAQWGCMKWQGITRQELGARWVSSMGVSLSEVRHLVPSWESSCSSAVWQGYGGFGQQRHEHLWEVHNDLATYSSRARWVSHVRCESSELESNVGICLGMCS